MFKRKDIMIQALEDPKSIKNVLPKGVSVIGRGVKIQQFDDGIQILNMEKAVTILKSVPMKSMISFIKAAGVRVVHKLA